MGSSLDDSITTSQIGATTVGAASVAASQNLDVSHPYFLAPSDFPGMQLVTSPFDGKGYGGWKRSMLIALTTKNKVGFINGSCPEPEINSNLYTSWTRCNNMVISWLLNSLSKEISESVIISSTAKDLWNELEERFGQSCGTRLFQLQKELSILNQGSNDIAGYYTKLKHIWDKLDTLGAYEICSCNCNCGVRLKI